MKRTLLALLLVLALCLPSFVGCDSGSGKETEAPSVEQTEEVTEKVTERVTETRTETEIDAGSQNAYWLEYTLNDDQASYSVTGAGTFSGGELVIPEKHDGLPVTAIGDYAFHTYYELTSVTISDSVTSIGEGAFKNSGLISVTVGNGVTSIGESAFEWCDDLTSVTIGDGVTSIGDRAFFDCGRLTSVVMGDSVAEIGASAFRYSDSIAEIIVSENNKHYCSIDGNLYSKDGTMLIQYAVGKMNMSFVIPDGVTSIGYAAFYEARNLTRLTIPNSVTSIDEGAFSGCKKLVEVYNLSDLDIKVTPLGEYAKNIYNNASAESKLFEKNGYVFYCDSEMGKYYLICYVGENSEIVLPGEVNGNSYEIYTYAFNNRRSLTSVTIPDGVTDIGDTAFYNCDRLTSVVIGDSVESIGGYAFCGCSSLTSMTIPNSVKSIDKGVFEDCFGLTSVVIGDSVESIGDGAFRYCSSLTSAVIPDSVKSIGENAFYKCSSLTSIIISKSVTSIGMNAFRDCSSLEIVYYTGSENKWNEIKIESNNTLLKNATIIYDYFPEEE